MSNTKKHNSLVTRVAEHLINNLGYEVDFTNSDKITSGSIDYVWVNEEEETKDD